MLCRKYCAQLREHCLNATGNSLAEIYAREMAQELSIVEKELQAFTSGLYNFLSDSIYAVITSASDNGFILKSVKDLLLDNYFPPVMVNAFIDLGSQFIGQSIGMAESSLTMRR